MYGRGPLGRKETVGEPVQVHQVMMPVVSEALSEDRNCPLVPVDSDAHASPELGSESP